MNSSYNLGLLEIFRKFCFLLGSYLDVLNFRTSKHSRRETLKDLYIVKVAFC